MLVLLRSVCMPNIYMQNMFFFISMHAVIF